MAVELDVLGITHCDIGEALAAKWQLPSLLTQVIGTHHKPEDDDADEVPAIETVAAAGNQL